MLTDLRCLPDQIELLLGQKEKIQHFANRYVGARDIFFIGRGIDYAISLEGSLKLKEISYIHSEAYAAGELKHGTISLIEDGTLVVALATQALLSWRLPSRATKPSRRQRIMWYTFPRRIRILPIPWQSFRCSCLLTMWQWDVAVMWISREIWQNPLRWNNKKNPER